MKDNTLQFEGYDAFDVIAGSSAGGWSDRDMAAEIIGHCVILSSDSGTAERLYRDLACTPDEEIDLADWTTEIVEAAIDSLPPYCTIEWRDNELTVLPYIDDDIIRLDHHLDHYNDGLAYAPSHPIREYLHVNDHGNVDMMVWNHNSQQFDNVWSMV